MSTPTHAGPVIVGVQLGQPIDVLLEGARLAAELGRDLLCAHVAADVVSTGWDRPEHFEVPADFEDGTSEHDLAPGLVAAIRSAVEPLDPRPQWSVRVLSGDAAHELAELAHETEARAIVVGGRRRGLDHLLDHLTSGSVSTRLAHDQPRPVVVVPDPGQRGHDRALLEAPVAAAEPANEASRSQDASG